MVIGVQAIFHREAQPVAPLSVVTWVAATSRRNGGGGKVRNGPTHKSQSSLFSPLDLLLSEHDPHPLEDTGSPSERLYGPPPPSPSPLLLSGL